MLQSDESDPIAGFKGAASLRRGEEGEGRKRKEKRWEGQRGREVGTGPPIG